MTKHVLTVKQSLLYTDLSAIGNRRQCFRDVLQIDYELPEFSYENGRISWDVDGDTSYGRASLHGRTLNQALARFIGAIEKSTNDLQATAHNISLRRDLYSISTVELIKIFGEYIEAYQKVMPMLFTFWNTEQILVHQLERIDLPLLFEADRVEEIMQTLLLPPKPSYAMLERESISSIVNEIAVDKSLVGAFRTGNARVVDIIQECHASLWNRLSEHLEEFGFTTTAFQLNPAMSLSELVGRLASIIKDNVDAKNEHLRNAEKARQLNKLLNNLAPFSEIRERAALVGWFAYWKNQRVDSQFASDYKVRNMFAAVADRLKITVSQLVFCSYREIMDGLNGEVIDHIRIIDRQRSYDYFWRNGEALITTKLRPTDAPLSNLPKHLDNMSDTLRGEIANRGIARGVVRIIRGPEDLASVKKGDVLVAHMTRPDMVSALENAVAIVTDEGGRLSHAAIIARELNKPCITGTGNATSFLKDGQEVIIDAEEGTVKIVR